MGSRVFDYLTESFLFDDSLIREDFSGISDDDILAELQRYREFCLSVANDVEAEIVPGSASLKIFSGTHHIDFELLKQSALYVEQHILYDPLFALTRRAVEPDANASVFNEFLGFPSGGFDRSKVVRVTRYLKALQPMIAANYVKLLPTSYFFEPPKELPFTASDTGFAERIPQNLLPFFHENAVVESIKHVDDQMIIDGSFDVGRQIHVRFKNHGVDDAHGYQLLEQKVTAVDRDSRKVSFSMYMPPTRPSLEEFQRWVYQSINQTAGHLYRRVLLENTFASRLGAAYLSNSPFVFELLEQIVPTKDNIQTHTANAVLSMQLPFIDRIDANTLMRVRMEEGEAFQTFRLELEKQLRELRLISDPETLRLKTENMVHELNEIQVRQVSQKLSRLRKRMLVESGIATVSFLGAIQSGGLTLPVALLAALQGAKDYLDYQSQKKENPAFFLWKVLGSKH